LHVRNVSFTQLINKIFNLYFKLKKNIMQGYIGEIRIFAGTFAPASWQFCNGSTISISDNETLFTLIGTTYGGDGVQTFCLPDLRSRVPIGTGQGPGFPNVVLGQVGGSENVTMSTSQMPGHVHVGTGTIALPALAGTDTTGSPSGAILAGLAGAYSAEASDTNLKPVSASVTIDPIGGNIPFSIMQPSMAINYIICIYGIFPTRN
jgi:microcystin-dependent protein